MDAGSAKALIATVPVFFAEVWKAAPLLGLVSVVGAWEVVVAQPAVLSAISTACKIRVGLNIIHPHGDTIFYPSIMPFA
jgi:hypothetical protein